MPISAACAHLSFESLSAWPNILTYALTIPNMRLGHVNAAHGKSCVLSRIVGSLGIWPLVEKPPDCKFQLQAESSKRLSTCVYNGRYSYRCTTASMHYGH
jgi:hypothetical protein